jgi:hypothetical protein
MMERHNAKTDPIATLQRQWIRANLLDVGSDAPKACSTPGLDPSALSCRSTPKGYGFRLSSIQFNFCQ